MDNRAIDDARLSLKAKGLLLEMLREPDTWRFSQSWLAGRSTDGVDAIRSAMDELKAARYLAIERTRNGKGQYAETVYWISETPMKPGTTEPE